MAGEPMGPVSGKSALYVTYDGLLDPLGGSQILPYIRAVAPQIAAMTVLSFEKPERLAGAAELRAALACEGIRWHPLRFTRGLGVVGKVWDLLKIHVMVVALAAWGRVGVVHARSHPAAQAALVARRLTGARLLFDMRGLWVDERVDKGGWNLARAQHRWQYAWYKRVERRLFAGADHLVVLTHAVVEEALRLGARGRERITVIPCCADFDHFHLPDAADRQAARREWGLEEGALVLGYLGSVGAMYLIERYLALGVRAMTAYPHVHLVVITPDTEAFEALVHAHVPASLRGRVHWRSAGRIQVPGLLAAADVMVSFIAPSYARMASSPTKLAEGFAMGLPTLCNPGTGDVAAIMAQVGGGRMVDPYDESALDALVRELPQVAGMGGARLRAAARVLLGLEVAARRYRAIYAGLLGGTGLPDSESERACAS